MSGTQLAGAQAVANQSITPQQSNMMARQLILRGGTVGRMYFPPAIDIWQPQNPSLPLNPQPGTVITTYLRNVGLVKRLVLRFQATVTAGASAQTRTPWGLSNFISNVTFWDLGNNQRINTTGWHLMAIASAKRRTVFGAAYTNDSPCGYDAQNTGLMSAPTPIAPGGSGEIDFFLEIPFVKNDTDLRGAIFADVTQATMQLQVTLNPQMFVPAGADPTLAMYQSAAADLPTLSGVTMQMYQNYLDMLPRNPQNAAPILPNLDIGTAYMLNNTATPLPVANQDNGTAFVNARTYESVTFALDNAGTLNINGSDLNYVALTSANMTNIIQLDGRMLGFTCRQVIGNDFPQGMYYLDFRHRPIDTNQFGNMQIILNPNVILGPTATVLFGWESYGIIGLVNQGGSIPMGA